MSDEVKENDKASFDADVIKNAVEEATKGIVEKNNEAINNLQEKIDNLENKLNEAPKNEEVVDDPIVVDDNADDKYVERIKILEDNVKLEKLSRLIDKAVEDKHIKDGDKAVEDLNNSKITNLYTEGKISGKDVITFLKGTNNKIDVVEEASATETISGKTSQETPAQVSEKEQKDFKTDLDKRFEDGYNQIKG